MAGGPRTARFRLQKKRSGSASRRSVTELGDNFFVQKTRNWQVSHSLPIGPTLINQFRIGYVGARADQHGFTAPQADIDAAA